MRDKSIAYLAKWFNLVADAHASKSINWAYPNGRSLMVRIYNLVYKLSGHDNAVKTIVRFVSAKGLK